MMRFGVSRVLDAIEERLTLDPVLARGVLDLAEVVRRVDLDGDQGKPASLLRLGRVIDLLGQHVAEEGVAVHVVAPRSLLSDLDLSSNERMVVRRWADDGLVEALAEADGRVREVAEQLGVPVLTRQGFQEVCPAGSGAAWLTRIWRCPEPGCPTFGTVTGGQPPPRIRSAAPTCPGHGTRLADAGKRPAARVLAARVDGAVCCRFVVREGAPVVVGRSPGEGVALGRWLGDEALRWLSRSHLRLELRGDALVATDTSTNGTRVRGVRMPAAQPYGIGADDVIELYQGVEVAAPAQFADGRTVPPESVMSDAPTVSLRLPR